MFGLMSCVESVTAMVVRVKIYFLGKVGSVLFMDGSPDTVEQNYLLTRHCIIETVSQYPFPPKYLC